MRLKEIEARIAEIKTELETRGEELTVEQSNTLVTEAEQLAEERKQLIEAAEKRNATLAGIASGQTNEPAKVVRTFAGADGQQEQDKFNTMAYRKAFMQYVTRGTAIPAEYRADASTKTTDVGAAIPTVVLEQIVSKLESVGNILNLVTKTAYKGGVSIPVETAKPVASWVAEGKGSDKQAYKGGTITFAYHKLRCAVAVSLEVDTMSIAAFETLLINNIVEAMTKALEEAIITGDGNGKPTGIIAADPVETVEAATLTYATLVDCEAAVPEAYEANAKWCMSKKTFMGFIGMVDGNGQPIARINYGLGGKPERFLLGREVVLTEHLPNFAVASAGDKVAFIFDFANYVLNTNYAIGVKKYEDNDSDDLVTKGIMLADGKVVDANGLVVLKKIASA